jgi:hypothetical protein
MEGLSKKPLVSNRKQEGNVINNYEISKFFFFYYYLEILNKMHLINSNKN